MFRIFRKTRKWLLSQQKFSKYFIYASGEVLLIVIGILIALAINNWNQSNQARDRERFYLQGLHDEFSQSRLKLLNLMEVNQNSYRDARKLAVMMKQNSISNEAELSTLLFNSLSYEIDYNPNNSLVTEIINTGGLKDISNPELRSHLTMWDSYLQSIRRQENSLREQREKLLDLFRKETYSIRTILQNTDISGPVLGNSQPNPEISNQHILKDREFENNLLIYIVTGLSSENYHYTPLLKEIDQILTTIEKELEN